MNTDILLGIDIKFKRPVSDPDARGFSTSNEATKISEFIDSASGPSEMDASLAAVAFGIIKYKCAAYGTFGDEIMDDIRRGFMVSDIIEANSSQILESLNRNPAGVAVTLKKILLRTDTRAKKPVLIVIGNFLLYFGHLFHIFDKSLTVSEANFVTHISEHGPCIL